MRLVRLRRSVVTLGRRSVVARRMVRAWRLRVLRPRWRVNQTATASPQSANVRVLLGTSVGGYLVAGSLDMALAAGLRQRGADVAVLLCDSALPACLECTFDRLGGSRTMRNRGPSRDLCPGCLSAGRAGFEDLGIPVLTFGEFLTEADRSEARSIATSCTATALRSLELDRIPIGEHAYAGALRFFARADLVGEPDGEAVLRRYVEAAILSARAMQRAIEAFQPDRVVLHHGIYVPQGLLGAAARAASRDVITWNPAYRKQCFIFSHGDTYHHTLLEEPTSEWDTLSWSDELERMTDEYLRSRWSGSNDWIWFHESPNDRITEIEREVGVDFSKPCIGMLTNVMWDAQLHYPANAFADMREWVLATIRYFATRPELQLLIRVHPAEIRGTVPSRQPIVAELERAYGTLPSNVFVVPPESHVSTYAAMSRCDAVLIYGTKTGVELTAMGIPTIVAGEAWIRNKGLTLDARSPSDYQALLDRLPLQVRLDEETIRRAKMYAFHFFFRRMIPIGFMQPTRDERVFRVDADVALEALRPGRDRGFDVICDGILRLSPFVYPAEAEPQTSASVSERS